MGSPHACGRTSRPVSCNVFHRTRSVTPQGSLLRELLSGGRDFGTLLGGGGAGARGALHALVPDAEERRRLFEGVAYECQVGASKGRAGMGGKGRLFEGVAYECQVWGRGDGVGTAGLKAWVYDAR